MAMTEMLPLTEPSGGGGNDFAFSDIKYVAGGNAPSWSGTPFKATKVLLINYLFDSLGRVQNLLVTNYDPSTGLVDNSKSWVSTDGSTWSVNNTALLTISDTSISGTSGLISSSASYNIFVIC